MEAFHEYIGEYKKLLKKGEVQKAYQGLMEYIMDLRSYFKKKYPDYEVSGSIYQGYMDMSYFSFFPGSLKRRKLKTGIVLVHDPLRFEIWLFGYNKNIQTKYIKIFQESNWDKYHIAETAKGIDFIIDHILIDNPDFSDLDKLTKQIEKGTLKFIKDIEIFLSEG